MSHRSDEALLDEMRGMLKRNGGITPSRTRVMKTFTVGAGRASRLLRLLGQETQNVVRRQPVAKQDELPLLASAPDFFGDKLIERCGSAAFAASQRVAPATTVRDQYRAIARAVLIEAMQERG